MWGYLRKNFNLDSPTVFDWAVVIFILMIPTFKFRNYSVEMMRGIVFIFGSIALLLLSMMMRPRRFYRSIPLCLLALWSMFHVFYHSFKAVDFGLVWINWCLLNEGFIFILFGVILIYTIVRYSQARWIYYLALMIVLAIAYKDMFDIGGSWSMTPILALLVAGTVTMLLRYRNWRLAIPAVIGAITISIYKWPTLHDKWISRPDIWKGIIARITFLGRGFYHTINTMGGMLDPNHKEFAYTIDRWGVGWRQNDLLEFGEYMGYIALLIIGWFVIDLLINSKKGFAYFLFLFGVLTCLFQRTIYFADKGPLMVVIVALIIMERRDALA